MSTIGSPEVSYYDSWVELLVSALRHGVDPEDIQHALMHALAVDEVGEDPVRYPVLGPDPRREPDKSNGPAVIHAMRMRPKYRRLLPGGRWPRHDN